MSDQADHVRALKFAALIHTEVIKTRAKHARCRVEALSAAEVSDYHEAIIEGIRRLVAREVPVPEIDAPTDSAFDRATVKPPPPPPPPLGALGPPAPPWPPEPPASAPFNDPLEDTPAFGDDAKRRQQKRSGRP